jgi:hypothetical protein
MTDFPVSHVPVSPLSSRLEIVYEGPDCNGQDVTIIQDLDSKRVYTWPDGKRWNGPLPNEAKLPATVSGSAKVDSLQLSLF